MGDQLIAEAECQLLKQFKKFRLVQITSAELWSSTRLLSICLNSQDILCITGGGYLGSLWPIEEYRVRSIIKQYHKNKIIILPQTIYYENIADEFCQTARIIYESHPDLYLFTREQQSFDFARQILMPNKQGSVFLVPDIAMTYQTEEVSNKISNNILFCLRTDKEQISKTNTIINKIRQTIPQNISIDYTDTQVPYAIPINTRQLEIKKKILEFSSYSLIITDRLHGMIYAAISGTPVIALDNASGKVGNVYNLWLNKLPYVFFVRNPNDVENIIIKALKTSHMKYDHELARSYFKVLNNIIQ